MSEQTQWRYITDDRLKEIQALTDAIQFDSFAKRELIPAALAMGELLHEIARLKECQRLKDEFHNEHECTTDDSLHAEINRLRGIIDRIGGYIELPEQPPFAPRCCERLTLGIYAILEDEVYLLPKKPVRPRSTLQSYLDDITQAAIEWQKTCSKKGRSDPETEMRSGYLYDRVRLYLKKLGAEAPTTP